MKKIVLILFLTCLSSIAFPQQRKELPYGYYCITNSDGYKSVYNANGKLICSGRDLDMSYDKETNIIHFLVNSDGYQSVYDANGKFLFTGKNVEFLDNGDIISTSSDGRRITYDYAGRVKSNSSQNYSQQPTQGVPPRSEWQNIIYIDGQPFVSHYAGQTHSVNVKIRLRKEYEGRRLKVYYKITCHNYNLDVYKCDYCEGYVSGSYSKTAFFNYRNSTKPVVSMSDFRIEVINVVTE